MSVEPGDEARPARTPLPDGYRQGIITAITVFLGFSLLFLRYWSFEAAGDWTVPSVLAALLMTAAVILEIIALWRSLQVEDDELPEYRKTLRWFMASVIALLAGLLLAAITVSGDPS